MVDRARVAMKFFVYGLAIGLLFAPRTGKETRGKLLEWANQSLRELLGQPPYQG